LRDENINIFPGRIGIPPGQYRRIVGNAVLIANEMLAQRTYTPKIGGRLLSFIGRFAGLMRGGTR